MPQMLENGVFEESNTCQFFVIFRSDVGDEKSRISRYSDWSLTMMLLTAGIKDIPRRIADVRLSSTEYRRPGWCCSNLNILKD
jgi:hypothetical protein